MKLSELYKSVGINAVPKIDEEITSVTAISGKTCNGAVFVCITGAKRDGHDYIDEAYRRGARSFVVSREISGYSDCNILFVKNARKMLAELCFAFYGNPEKSLCIIGITGTKGKSTTGFVLYKLLDKLCSSAAFLGTLGSFGISGEGYINTTPSPEILARAMARARALGKRFFILEVSSQAIKEERIHSLPISVGVFTSLGIDHVGEGEHESFEEYKKQKRRLFTDYGVGLAITNKDDESSDFMTGGVSRVISVGSLAECDFRIENVVSEPSGTSFSLGGNFCNIKTAGGYNAYNYSLAAAAASVLTKTPIFKIAPQLEDISVRGRFEIIEKAGRRFVIDYAHNGMSVSALLSECKKMSRGRVIAVFGSVGEKAKGRRRELAAAAERCADFSVITSDNPNFEDVSAICAEIYSNFADKERAVIIADRTEAIRYAFSVSSPGDTVALLGKGHEDFQLILGKRVPFCEREIVASLGE